METMDSDKGVSFTTTLLVLSGVLGGLYLWIQHERRQDERRARELEAKKERQKIKAEEMKLALEQTRRLEKQVHDLLKTQEELRDREKEMMAENARSVIAAERAQMDNKMVRLGVGVSITDTGIHGKAALEMSEDFALAATQAVALPFAMALNPGKGLFSLK